ncbi:MAG: NYN domain-containing protein [bacterium]
MERVAVFVDAGYLFAQGSTALAGQKLPRSGVTLACDKVVEELEKFAVAVSGIPLLRIYWYDGTSEGPSTAHLSLAHCANVKVRLGFVNSVGEQKGVDSLIVTDMITLARNRAMADAVLLSGDEDLRVGVQQAQEYGIRVHLLGIRPSRGSQSLFLLQESDTTHEWGPGELGQFMTLRKEATPLVKPVVRNETAVAPSNLFLDVATRLAASIPAPDLKDLVETIASSPEFMGEHRFG